MSNAVRKAFKFRECNENDLDALTNNYLWFSSLAELNDPFEGYGRYCCEGVTDGLRLKYLKAVLAETSDSISAELSVRRLYMQCIEAGGQRGFATYLDNETRKIVSSLHEREKKRVFVCSMSLSKDDCQRAPSPLSNMQMWSHYAGGFRGLCIEFDYDKLVASIEANNDKEYLGSAGIKYVVDGHLPAISLKKLMQGKLDSAPEVTVMELMGTVVTKHVSWNYENEVRLLGNRRGKIYFDPECIRSVYLASSMPEKSKSLVRSAVAEKGVHIDIYEVHLNREQYQLGFEKVALS